jgi:N-acetylglutamate synthase-like GNAT family acetyltransferase
MKIIEKSPEDLDALKLMDELSQTLKVITGDSGKNSFNTNDVCVPRATFIIAYDENGEAIGCGAIRPINDNIAEMKRVYSKVKGMGIGTKILSYLEAKAKILGYSSIWLETRLINERAVDFYEGSGYHRINNYGKYANNAAAVCFEKKLYKNP